MRSLWTALEEDMRPDTKPGTAGPSLPAVVLPFADDRAARQSDAAIQLDSCARLETIVVKTRASVYELIVLDGNIGDVLVRGGRAFPGCRRARLTGSTAGGTALKVGSIDVGLHLELVVDGRPFVTSTIQAISRSDALPGRAL